MHVTSLVAVTQTTLQVRVDVSLLWSLRTTDDVVTTGVEEVVKVWALAALEAGLGGEWLGATARDVGLHGRALLLE